MFKGNRTIGVDFMYNKVRSISIDGFKTDYIQLQDLEGGQDDIWFIVDDKFLSKKIVNLSLIHI